jgi:hypothetical protein
MERIRTEEMVATLVIKGRNARSRPSCRHAASGEVSNKHGDINVNNNQRISIVVSLVIIGLTLAYTMVEYGDGSGIRFGIRIFSFYPDWIPFEPAATFPARMAAAKQALYVRGGIPGILLGLVAPLGLWVVAAYIALGLARGSKVQS